MRLFLFISLIPGLVLFSACWAPEDHNRDFKATIVKTLTKDDVLLVDGRKLSLSGYSALRGALPQSIEKDEILWVATAALALQNELFSKGKEINLPLAVKLAHSAISHEPLQKDLEPFASEYTGIAHPLSQDLKTRLDQLIGQAKIQRNLRVLAELR